MIKLKITYTYVFDSGSENSFLGNILFCFLLICDNNSRIRVYDNNLPNLERIYIFKLHGIN